MDFKEKRYVSLDKSKIECYNCHRKWHFARECRSGRRGYDWSNDFEVELVNYALMAISLSNSSSYSDSEVQKCSKCLESFKCLQKNYDTEREKHNKAKLEIRGYEIALESLEARILGHEKNELTWGERYEFQNYDLKCREIKINNLNLELEKVVKERDELKLKIEKLEGLSKNLTKILNSQMNTHDKNGLGFGTQMDDLSNKSKTDSKNSLTVFEVRSGNLLTPRADISFAGLDGYAFRNKIIESKTTETNKTIGTTNEASIVKHKSVNETVVSESKINRDEVIIEDWTSDDEDDVCAVKTVSSVKPNSHEPRVKNVVNTGKKVVKPVWDYGKRVNHQNFSKILKYPHAKRTFNPSAVLTRAGLVNTDRSNVSTARSISTVRLVYTVRLVSTARPLVSKIAQSNSVIRPNHPRLDIVRPKDSNTPIKRSYFTQPVYRPKYLKPDVKTFGVKNMTTVGTMAVVNKGKDNPEILLQDHAVVDSGCSSHMTGNKTYLSDYEDLNGGFVSFESDPKGGKITGKGKIKTANLDFDDVYFVDELKFNIFFVSQMCDKKNSVLFTESECLILSPSFKLLDESQVVLKAPRKDGVYSLDLKNIVPSGGITCLYANATTDESKLWHRRLGQVNFKNISQLVKGHLVRGLPLKIFVNDHTCVACKKGKQHKASCKAKLDRIIRMPLELLPMNLFGLVSIESINEKRYCLVVTDDFSRFSWVFFLATKDETSEILCNLIIGLEKQLNYNVKIIRCDNGTEFKNYVMNELCAKKGIKREFSVARTPQQNGVVERKNRTLIEAARTMLADSLLPIPFWAEAVNTACYVLNRVIVDAGTQDSYVAGSSVNDKGPTQEYILLPLQPHRTRIPVKDVVQDAHEQPSENAYPDKGIQVLENVFDKEGQHQMPEDEQVWQDELEMMVTQEVVANAMNDESRQSFEEEKRRIASQKKAAQAISTNQLSTDRPFVSTGRSFVSTDRSNTPNVSAASTSTGANADESSFVYLGGKIPIDASTLPNADLPIDPNMPDLEDASDTLLNDRIFNGAYDDDEDVGAVVDFNNMDNTIAVSPIPTLRIHKDHPKGQILGDPTSAVQQKGRFKRLLQRNKPYWVEAMQEELLQFKLQQVWILVDLPFRKKAIGTKLVAQGHGQEEGIDYDEVFAPVATIEAIRLFLAFATYKGFLVYQMDVKSAFLYGIIEEEVHVHQPPGFIDPVHPNKVYKVKQQPNEIFISQDKYVADILKKFDFCFIKTATTPIESNKPLVKDEDGVEVDVHEYRSMIGSLMYLTSSRPDIMFAVCACARFQVTLKASYLHAVKRIFRYLKHQPKLGLWYPMDSLFELEAFADSDYAGASLDRKSTTGGCQFLGRRLISWQCKKQTIVANSTTEAEYVAAAHCCGQVLWIQNQMMDYGFNFMNTKIHIDNESTICVVKNPVYHSRTKHIEIRHHFIRDCYEKRLIDVLKIHTDSNVADLLTKGFDVTRGGSRRRNQSQILGAAKLRQKVASQSVSKVKSTDKGKRYRRRARSMAKKIDTRLDAGEEINTDREEINTGIEEVSTGSTKVDSGTVSKRGQREGKAPMVEEDIQATHKTKEQMRQEETGLEEAIKLQTQLDEEVAKQIYLDKMVAKRMAEEEDLSEQQKKRKAQLEANAELTKDVLGKDLPEQDFAKRMAEMNQGTWKLSQLKKLKFEEIKEEFDKFDDKDVPGYNETKVVESKGRRSRVKRRKKKEAKGKKKDISARQRTFYHIIRANGADTVYMSFGAMIKDFTREDLIEFIRTMFDPLSLKMLFGAYHFNKRWSIQCQKACQVMLEIEALDGKMNEVCYKLLKMIEKQAGIRK
ncbi:putative ribonuclease H-like domain-containing protein [Tanacetum coccineum]